MQTPLSSGLGPQTTATEALGRRRLDGVPAIVTGGYAGVGLETTRALARAGATVVVPARTPEKARAALAGLEGVTLDTLDLAQPASIAAFAGRFLASGRPLNILVNNAGIMATPLSRDARGFDSGARRESCWRTREASPARTATSPRPSPPISPGRAG